MENPWSEIKTPTNNLNVRRVDHQHPRELFWGKDTAGKYCFLFKGQGKSGAKVTLPKLSGISTQLLDGNPSGFLLTLVNSEDWELFAALCSDLVEGTRFASDESGAFESVLKRLIRWQEFLRAGRNRVMSESEAKGLFGELLYLQEELMPNFSVADVVTFWQGPEGSPQDFNVGSVAIEVKCRAGTANPIVRINSAAQLCPDLDEMYLYVLSVGRAPMDDPSALSLHSLVEQIRETIKADDFDAFERFNDLLLAAGYVDLEEYKAKRYIPSSRTVYEVRDGFPRLCPNSLPEGVGSVRYELSLSAIQNYVAQLDWKKRTI